MSASRTSYRHRKLLAHRSRKSCGAGLLQFIAARTNHFQNASRLLFRLSVLVGKNFRQFSFMTKQSRVYDQAVSSNSAQNYFPLYCFFSLKRPQAYVTQGHKILIIKINRFLERLVKIVK